MSTSFYQWGILSGGEDPGGGGPPTPSGSDYGPPEQFSGSLTGSVTTLTFSSSTKKVTVRNIDDQNALQYSFDNSTWFNYSPYGVVQEVVKTTKLYLKSTAGSSTYEVLGILS
jgi:hypothetical protein